MNDELMNVVTRLFWELHSFNFLIEMPASTQAMKWKSGLNTVNKTIVHNLRTGIHF